MYKTKIKKLAKKIIIGLFLALFVLASSSILLEKITNNSLSLSNTAYAAEPDCGTDAAKDKAVCKKVGDNCPTGYVVDGENCKKEATSQTDTESTKNMIKFLIKLQDILNTLIWPVLVMIGGLLDNSILFGNGMEERLREIWIPIRNIVNILFVIALVGIALYNVLGIGDDNSNYSIKSVLPKIIVGIIAVNFSFLGIKLFLDVINVLTVSIFALPNQVGQATVLDSTKSEDQETIDHFCKAYDGKKYNEVIDPNQFTKTQTDNTYRTIGAKYLTTVEPTDTKEKILEKIDALNDPTIKQQFQTAIDTAIAGEICTAGKISDGKGGKKDGLVLTSQGELFLKRWNSRNAALAMALNLSNIVYYEKLDVATVANIEQLFVNGILSLMLYLIFLASFVALFIVLLGRLVVMWLAIALSPVLLLGLAVPVIKEKISGFGDLTSKFVGNAIVPLGIALSLTIGWIMLNALQGVNSLYNGGSISFTAGKGLPVVGLTTLQDLLVGLGTLAVIWLGVFTAASKSIAAPVTDMLKGALTKVGSFIGTMPLRQLPLFQIDLPGAGEDNKFTGSQIMHAIDSFSHPKDIDKLTKLLNPQAVAAPASVLADQEKTKDDKGVYSWVNTGNRAAQLKALEAETIEAFRKFKSENPAYGKLKQPLKGHIDKLLDGTPEEKKTAAEAIAELAKRSGQSGLKVDKATPQSTGDTKQPQAPAKPDQPPVTKDTKGFGSEVLKEDEVPRYQTRRDSLVTAIETGKLQTIQASLTTLNQAGGTKNLTAANLETILDKETYKALVKTFGTKEKLTEYLETLPKTPAGPGVAGVAGAGATGGPVQPGPGGTPGSPDAGGQAPTGPAGGGPAPTED